MTDKHKTRSRELGQSADWTPDFVNLDQKRYSCVKCRELLREPQQMKCGHRICKICFQALVAGEGGSGEDTGVVVCPGSDDESCDEEVQVEEVYPDYSAVKEMKSLMVFCPYKRFGCSETMQWVKIKEHTVNCSYRMKTCSYCELKVPVEQFEHHLNEECEKLPMLCPYNCSSTKIPRSRMNDHLRTCESHPKECSFHHMGCDFKGNEKQLVEHRNNHQHHLNIVLQYNKRLAREKLDLEEKLQRLSVELGNIRSELSRRDSDKNELEINMTRLKSDQLRYMELHKQETAQALQRLRLLEQRVAGNAAGEVTIEKMNEDVSMIQMRQRQQVTVINDLKTQLEQLTDRAASTSGILQTHDSMLQQLQNKLLNLELRCTCVEATSYDGTLTWKITSFAERRRDAKEGRHISVYSEPFYSRRYGYKMCCRLYPNGDGIGAGTHLSLFFVVMRGEYDDILEWPFNCKVKMMLLNQVNSRKHREDGFKPDPASTSYQKPVEFMNKASGCPKFISLADLEEPSNGFLENNCIYLRIVVDPPS